MNRIEIVDLNNNHWVVPGEIMPSNPKRHNCGALVTGPTAQEAAERATMLLAKRSIASCYVLGTQLRTCMTRIQARKL